MAQVTFLGTGSALSGPERENTFMLVQGKETNLLIDCAGGPTQRLAAIGISPAAVDHIILTHNHPDHIYGLPLLLLNSWMAGRRTPIHLYGLQATMRSARALLRALDMHELPNFFKIKYHPVVPNSITSLPPIGEFDVKVVTAIHFVPTMALRVTERATGKSMAYSADTSPHPNIVEIARDVDCLIHEATMLDVSGQGHSSAVEAGRQAAAAHAHELVLLHVPPDVKPSKWRAAAKTAFPGKVIVANDFDSVEF